MRGMFRLDGNQQSAPLIAFCDLGKSVTMIARCVCWIWRLYRPAASCLEMLQAIQLSCFQLTFPCTPTWDVCNILHSAATTVHIMFPLTGNTPIRQVANSSLLRRFKLSDRAIVILGWPNTVEKAFLSVIDNSFRCVFSTLTPTLC